MNSQDTTSPAAASGHVCPWWIGYILASPIRKWWEDPGDILEPHVTEGMTVLDIGSGMGYFTLPAARLVGETGRVIAVDLQQRMINSLKRRSRRAGLETIIDPRVCKTNSLMIGDLAEQVDFALAFHVLHETPSIESTLKQIWHTLKPGARLLVAEPRGHVTEEQFDDTRRAALGLGFATIDEPSYRKSWTLLLERPGTV